MYKKFLYYESDDSAYLNDISTLFGAKFSKSGALARIGSGHYFVYHGTCILKYLGIARSHLRITPSGILTNPPITSIR